MRGVFLSLAAFFFPFLILIMTSDAWKAVGTVNEPFIRIAQIFGSQSLGDHTSLVWSLTFTPFLFCCARDQAQGLEYARQAIYPAFFKLLVLRQGLPELPSLVLNSLCTETGSP